MIKARIQTKYIDEDVNIFFERYGNGRTAISGYLDNGEHVFVATVNLPDEPLALNQVFVKGWSENEGLPAELERLGIVGPIIDTVPTGFVRAERRELLVSK